MNLILHTHIFYCNKTCVQCVKPRRHSSYIGGPKSQCVWGPSHTARTVMCCLPADFQHSGGCIRKHSNIPNTIVPVVQRSVISAWWLRRPDHNGLDNYVECKANASWDKPRITWRTNYTHKVYSQTSAELYDDIPSFLRDIHLYSSI